MSVRASADRLFLSKLDFAVRPAFPAKPEGRGVFAS